MYKKTDMSTIIGIVFGILLTLSLIGLILSIPVANVTDWIFLLGTSSTTELIEFIPLIENYKIFGAFFVFVLTFVVSIIFDFGGYFTDSKRWRVPSIIIYFILVIVCSWILFPLAIIQQGFLTTFLLIVVSPLATFIGKLVGNYLYTRYELEDTKRRDIGIACLVTFFIALGVMRALFGIRT